MGIIDLFWRKRTESDVVRRYARALASSLQRKYVDFASIADERANLDVAVLCFHRVPRLRGIVGGSEDELMKELASAGLGNMSTQNVTAAVAAFRRYKGYQEVFDVYAALLSRELALYSEVRDQLQSVQASISRALDMNISSGLKRLISQIASSLATLQNYVELRIALVRRTQLDCQSPGTVEEFQQDIVNTVHIDAQAEQVYSSLLQVLRSYFPREKASFERVVGRTDTARSPIAASLLLALTLFSSACEMSTAQNQQAPVAQASSTEEKEKPQEEKTGPREMSDRRVSTMAADPADGAVYVRYGRDTPEVWKLLPSGESVSCGTISGDASDAHFHQSRENVYLFVQSSAGNRIFQVTGGKIIPLVVPAAAQPLGNLQVSISSTVDGDVFVFFEGTRDTLLVKPRGSTQLVPYALPAGLYAMPLVKENGTSFVQYSPSGDKILAAMLDARADEYSLVLGVKDGAGTWRYSVIDRQCVIYKGAFDVSGRFYAYTKNVVVVNRRESNVLVRYVVVYDLQAGREIFTRPITPRQEGGFAERTPVMWDGAGQTLVFTSIDDVRYQYIHTVVITPTGAAQESVKTIASKVAIGTEGFVVVRGKVFYSDYLGRPFEVR